MVGGLALWGDQLFWWCYVPFLLCWWVDWEGKGGGVWESEGPERLYLIYRQTA